MTQRQLGNGSKAKLAYDPSDRLNQVVNTTSANVTLSSYDYAIDGIGNFSSAVEDGTRPINWGTDSLNQITSDFYFSSLTSESWMRMILAQWDSFTLADWDALPLDSLTSIISGSNQVAYSPAGNRTQRTEQASSDPTTYTYSPTNRLTAADDVSGRTTYTYDSNGNVLTIEEPGGDLTTNTWDGENRLVQVEHPDSSITTYSYNADGLRVEEDLDGVVKRLVYDGNNVQLETDDVGALLVDNTYVPGQYAKALSQRRDGDSSFYLADGTKNIRQLTDSAQSVTDEYEFDAWGNSLSSTGSTPNAQQYKGQELAYRADPDAGPELQYALHFRQYDPHTARFTSRDPAEDDLNLYRYVKNNPVNEVDPSGLAGDEPTELPDLNNLSESQFKRVIQKAVSTDSATALFAGVTLTGYAVPFTTSVGDFYAILEESSIDRDIVGPYTSYRLAGIVPANGYKAKTGIELLVTDNARLSKRGAAATGLEFALHFIPLGAAADYASQGKGRQAVESLVGDVGTALTFGAGKVFQVGKLAIRMGSKVGRAGVTIDASLGIYRTAQGGYMISQGQGGSGEIAEGLLRLFGVAVHMSRAPIGAAPAAGYQPKSPSAPTQPPAASRFGKQPTDGDLPKTTGDIPNPITSGKPTPFTERSQQPTATPNATGSTPSSSGSGPKTAKLQGSVPSAKLEFRHQIKADKVTDIAELNRQVERQVAKMNEIIEKERMQGLKRRIRNYNKRIEQEGRNYVKTLEDLDDGLAWLHEPDMRTGGGPKDVTGIGDSRVNSIIGGQARALARKILDMPDSTLRIEPTITLIPSK